MHSPPSCSSSQMGWLINGYLGKPGEGKLWKLGCHSGPVSRSIGLISTTGSKANVMGDERPRQHLATANAPTQEAWKPPLQVVKAATFLMHLPLLSIHFYHAQSFFLALNIPLSFNALFTLSLHPVIGLPLSLIPLISNPTNLFTNRSSSIPSMCPKYLNTHYSARPSQHFRNTSSPSHVFFHSVNTCYSTHTPFLGHLISITLNLFSVNTKTKCFNSYSAVGRTTPPSFIQPPLYINSHHSTTKHLYFFQHLSYIIDSRLKKR